MNQQDIDDWVDAQLKSLTRKKLMEGISHSNPIWERCEKAASIRPWLEENDIHLTCDERLLESDGKSKVIATEMYVNDDWSIYLTVTATGDIRTNQVEMEYWITNEAETLDVTFVSGQEQELLNFLKRAGCK